MADGNGADAPNATTSAAHAAPASDQPASAPPAAPAAAAPAPEVAAPSKDDWVGMVKSMRTIADALTKGALPAPAKPQPAPSADVATVAADLAAVKRDLALERAFSAHGVAATSPLRELISIAAASANPPDLSAFVAQYARLGNSAVAPPATAPPAPVIPPIAPTNTGAPQAGPSATSTRTDNPRQWPPEKVNAMSVEEFRAEMAAYDARNGVGNPFRSMRQQLDKRLDPLRKR